MKSTELHPTTVRLGAVRWGSFELIFEGVNTTGTPCRCTVLVDWRLWPMIAQVARSAWVTEEQSRTLEMEVISECLPSSGGEQLIQQVEKRRKA